MSEDHWQSWGRYPQAEAQVVRRVWWQDQVVEALRGERSLLARGLGRSQGDSCLNDEGTLLDITGLNRFLAFDEQRGVLRCEAGVTFDMVLRLVVPRGWFLPVTPGTKFVTMGGAIANDVHGKNHHRAGSFGGFVIRLGLRRSDGTEIVCSETENTDWLAATIGGLGLTGVIVWAEFRLQPISSAQITFETIRLDGLADFWRLAEESDRSFDYTVAWIDCLARGDRLGRGVFIRGNHVTGDGTSQSLAVHRSPRWRVPIDMPTWVSGWGGIKLFNGVYRQQQLWRLGSQTAHYDPFFYPLDGVRDWNRFYGRRGFLQYQCVIPQEAGVAAITELLTEVADSQLASFLSTMKLFGPQRSPGMLSFPRQGITLAVDFAARGQATLDLLDRLDEVVERAGGALYPAKDARMSEGMFKQSFPRWSEFNEYVDPVLSSSFWRRIHS